MKCGIMSGKEAEKLIPISTKPISPLEFEKSAIKQETPKTKNIVEIK